MLKLDWMFRPRKNNGNIGFGGLLEVLADAPETIMDTVMVRTLVQNFYDVNKQRVVIFCYLPFIIYFIASIVYYTNFMFESEITEISNWSYWRMTNLGLMVLLIVYLLYLEAK